MANGTVVARVALPFPIRVDKFLRKSAASLISDWRPWLLAIAAALIWIGHFDRWTPKSWGTPTDYYSDAHESLARLKAASEGDEKITPPS